MIARLHGIGVTEVRISETVEKTLAIAAKALVIVGRIIATAGAIDTTAEKIIRIAGGIGVPTKRISARIVKFDGTTNDIIPQGQIAGTATLLNITGMDIPADRTEGEVGAKLTDAKTVKKPFDPVFLCFQKLSAPY